MLFQYTLDFSNRSRMLLGNIDSLTRVLLQVKEQRWVVLLENKGHAGRRVPGRGLKVRFECPFADGE